MPISIDAKITTRGFIVKEFRDTYGKACSLQESSCATAKRIWLGVNSDRMHLSPEQVKELLPALINFANGKDLDFVPQSEPTGE